MAFRLSSGLSRVRNKNRGLSGLNSSVITRIRPGTKGKATAIGHKFSVPSRNHKVKIWDSRFPSPRKTCWTDPQAPLYFAGANSLINIEPSPVPKTFQSRKKRPLSSPKSGRFFFLVIRPWAFVSPKCQFRDSFNARGCIFG